MAAIPPPEMLTGIAAMLTALATLLAELRRWRR
jgi:hypothetical protein